MGRGLVASVAMIRAESLAGYILEEVLASFIQTAGYQLITDPLQDPDDLAANNAGDLLVRGRGADHQVDVLGEFTITPAFSMPLRLVVEAKIRKVAMGIEVLRNAVGTINDVNEAWMTLYSENRIRRHYRYALFSTSGFTKPAQSYAIAHQIALLDLSGPEWGFLRNDVTQAADDLIRAVPEEWNQPYPVRQLRRVLRSTLGTAQTGWSNSLANEASSALSMQDVTTDLRRRLAASLGGALLAFPAAEQVLLARPDDLGAFLAWADHNPEHEVILRLLRDETGTRGSTWTVQPASDPTGYSLRVTLPTAVEHRALAESDRRRSVRVAKGALGASLDIFWDPGEGEEAQLLSGPRIFRLQFAESELRQRRRSTDW
jgi:hypothetical protein